MPNSKPLPKLFLALDLTLEDANFSNLIKILKNNPAVGLKVHSLLDQAFLNKRFAELEELPNYLWYDAKLADIPSTVSQRISNLSQSFDAVSLNLEAVGFEGALIASQTRDDIFQKTGKYINLVGVTVLTSKNIDDYSLQSGLDLNLGIKNLVEIAIKTNLDEVVCSPLEAVMVKYLIDKNQAKTKLITTGIKPEWAVANQTQSRSATPFEAIENGSDALVVGTAILKSNNPDKAIKDILQEIQTAKPKANLISKMNLNQKIASLEVLDVFKEIGAVYSLNQEQQKDGIWCRLTSGLLSPFYINIGGIIDGSPKVLNRIAQDIAKQVKQYNLQPECTVGAMMGSVRLSSNVANFLNLEKSIYLEKKQSDKKAFETEFALKRHKIKKGLKVIIVEDLITKGTTLEKMVKALKQAEAEILGIFLTINRSGIKEIEGVKVYALQDLEPFSITQAEFEEKFPLAKISEKPKGEWERLVINN